MPTTRQPLLLTLGLLSATSAALGQPASEELLTPDFGRVRPGAATVAGPQGVPRKQDPAIEPASFEQFGEAKPIDGETPSDPIVTEALTPAEPAPLPQDQPAGRRLLGSPKTAGGSEAKRSSGLPDNPLKALAAWRPSTRTLTATGGGLAITIGLVISFTWLVRSLAPKSSRPLPKDVVEVLGRVPLGAKQTTQLVRVGGKLLLIAITPEGAETLTEITDPAEVARLIAACESSSGRGQSAEFDSMLREMSDERVAPGFLGGESAGFADSSFDPRSLAAAYANTPGGRGDA